MKSVGSRQSGFSLVEMLVVLSIIIVAGAAVSFAYWNVLHTQKTASGADTVKSMLAATRQSAISAREYRALELDLADNSAQSFRQAYSFDKTQDKEIQEWESTTGVEKVPGGVDITDVCFDSETTPDLVTWEDIALHQTKVRFFFNPRGSLYKVDCSLPDGTWKEDEDSGISFNNPVVHIYSLGRSGIDKENGTLIKLSGETYPYRSPEGQGDDVLSNFILREKVRSLPADSLERKKCYSVKIYATTGRAVAYQYGLAYPWPSELMQN